MASIKVIIPAINEGDSIGLVVSEIPEHVSEIVVVDNGSSDDTVANAKKPQSTGELSLQERHLEMALLVLEHQIG